MRCSQDALKGCDIFEVYRISSIVTKQKQQQTAATTNLISMLNKTGVNTAIKDRDLQNGFKKKDMLSTRGTLDSETKIG